MDISCSKYLLIRADLSRPFFRRCAEPATLLPPQFAAAMTKKKQKRYQRIALFSAASRPTGYTREIESLFAQGVHNAGGALEEFRLPEMHIAECRGCYGCWNPSHPGHCVLPPDDMALAAKALVEADAVVFSTPLYFFSFASSLKRFFERLLPMTEPGSARGGTTDVTMNRTSSRLSRRPAVFICTAAHREMQIFDGVRSSFDLIADALNLEPAGVLLRPESFFLDFGANKPSVHRKVHTAFTEAASQLVLEGRVRPQTVADAQTPLTISQEVFDSHFTTYWSIAKEAGLDGAKRRELRDLAGRDLRILMPELASSYDPEAGGELNARIRFELNGPSTTAYVLLIEHHRCRIVADTGEPATLTISTTADILSDVLLQKVDIRSAYADKRLVVSGDRSLFIKLGKLFLAGRR